MTTRATHGIGFSYTQTHQRMCWKQFISERIIKIWVRGERETKAFIQAYAPCNDSYTEEQKEEFFKKMADMINTVPDTDQLVVMGDFSGRVGKRRAPWEPHLGPHSDTTTECNYNREQLLALCAEHGLWTGNTFHEHRQSQRQTWYRWNDLNVSAQIDFMLTRIEEWSRVADTRCIPNADLDTDHHPVIVVSDMQKGRPPRTRRKACDRQIKPKKTPEGRGTTRSGDRSHKEAGKSRQQSRQHRHDSIRSMVSLQEHTDRHT